ncbi:MAG: DUF1826 domain-containing protein [bacterium]|nr:DUF1826 domain-containing protein [bacterium]
MNGSSVSNIARAESFSIGPDAGLHLPHVVSAHALQDLFRVREEDVNLVVLPREPAPELARSAGHFGEWLKETLALDLSQFDIESAKLTAALREVFASAMPPGSEANYEAPDLSLFAWDVAELAENFARIAKASSGDPGAGRNLRLRLDRVESDMCAAFHTDCYRMRLICTYRGTGTEWTANDNVNRREFYSLPAAERLLDSQRVFRLRTGWVAILKGESFPGAEGSAVVHRSPPASAEDWRLVLRIDCD